jgi:hypothetical protein
VLDAGKTTASRTWWSPGAKRRACWGRFKCRFPMPPRRKIS